MHKSVYKSSVPDSYTLLFIVKSYLNVSVLMSDMYVCICMYICICIYSGYGKYSDPLKFFTLCYIAAIC